MKSLHVQGQKIENIQVKEVRESQQILVIKKGPNFDKIIQVTTLFIIAREPGK